MTSYPEASSIKSIIDAAQTIVIMQADNPDGDSLGSALALEHILGDMGKQPVLYCGVDIPTYLRYVPGWDRVQKDIPRQFDAAIIVDTSAISLFGNLEKTGQKPWVAAKPTIILDHHNVTADIPFANVICNQPVVATGEIIYELSQQLTWPLNHEASQMLAISILSDSLGLMSEATTARSIHIIAELAEKGVKLAELDEKRRAMYRKKPELVHYKGQLLQRIAYHADDRIATVTIPWEEIERYSNEYNPSMLVIDDMRLTENTEVVIAFKTYNDGKVTAKIRCNLGHGIAGKLAEHFGGGGHIYASGFKVTDGRPFEQIQSECIAEAVRLLDSHKQEMLNETAQQPDQTD